MSEQKPTAEAVKELIKWSNSKSLLLSLLYDLDLMPEQIAKSDTVRFSKMVVVMLHFKQLDVEHSITLVAKDAELIAKDEQLVAKDFEILSLKRKIEEVCRLLQPLGAGEEGAIKFFHPHSPELRDSVAVKLTTTLGHCRSVAAFIKQHSAI